MYSVVKKWFHYFYRMLLKYPGLNYVPQKIISLVPSQTELLHYLGLENETIGITKFCIHPHEWFITKKRVGGTKNIDHKKIATLHPDLVIANKEENTKEDIETLSAKYPVWLTDIHNLAGALEMIRDIGKLTARNHEAMALAKLLKKLYPLHFKKTGRIAVVYLIWKDPFMTVGGDTFINSMLEYAGFDNVFSDLSRYPVISMEDINNSAARIILLSSEPYPFKEKHLKQMTLDTNKKIVLADGEMFSWYGSRLLYAKEYFKKIMDHIHSI